MKRNRGFTLIELLIVVAVIGILAAIAYPSYRSQILKSHRSDGQALLLDIAARQERFFFDNDSGGSICDPPQPPLITVRYAEKLCELKLIKDSTVTELNTPEGYYVVAIDAPVAACPSASCYVARAKAQNGQVDDKCGGMTLDSMGRKGITNKDGTGNFTGGATNDAGLTAADCW